ncbi:MAG TPA: PTS sugar transporter subunit IIB [Tetragenococcus sp.]|nr:PTS sugar transporter subunit IIB [Tetragenococcus sp.]
MSEQKMVRIDYRLIHGQIIAKWIKFRPVDRLIVADDELVQDDFMSDIYKMAVPEHDVDIIKVADLKQYLEKKDDKVMVIFKDVTNALKAYKEGVSLKELNVGAVQSQKDRQTITSGVALSAEEYKSLTEMQDSGVDVYVQPIPENEKITLKSLKQKFE